ncbi:VWA domain-containing protein [Occallatibacter savannae]|uniref:VWA domain-containing protein n=1 Tax=Occallatibacter savannae TaxID=1002691 RepID=UPI000D68C73C|nr:VWA domain-containing protein [Occallatibacter savannae]
MSTKFSCLAALAVALCLSASGQPAYGQQQQPPAPQPAQTPAPQQPAPAEPASAPAQAGQPASGQQPAAGQQPPDQQGAEDTGQVFRVGVNEVNLIFTVTDKHGHYVPNLKQSDFALLDDQKAPEKVTSFRQQVNLPLRVGIVIDASTSIRTRFQFEQQAAVEFLLQILKAKSDRAFVMGFDVTPDIKADWTNNIDALETGINRLRPGGGTAMYDAVFTGCKTKLLDSSRGQEPVRKAMILISDGDDNQSRVHLDEAIKMCQRAETIVYAISTNWTPSRGKGDQVLTQLAQDTGGQVFFPPSVEQMSNSFKNIEEELRSQYALTYIPADFKANGQFRPIYLYCTDRRYVARARKGYFAPKE